MEEKMFEMRTRPHERLIDQMISDIINGKCDEETKKKYVEEMKKIFSRSKNLIPYLYSKGHPAAQEEENIARKIEVFFKDQNIVYEQ